MIQPQSKLLIADNTGAKKIMCINILGSNKKYAQISDLIIGVVKESEPDVEIKKSSVIKAIIIRTKKKIKRKDQNLIRFDDNAAIIVNNKNEAKGTRIFGPIAYEVKQKFNKISNLAVYII
jgi:large subunit ribosomal protein L14